MSKFNQINSLCYWLSSNTNYDCTAVFDSNEDLFSVTILKGGREIYSYSIISFEKKGEKIISFELSGIINNLLHLKNSYLEQR
ncbi:hypothetical protein LV716_01695 [Flagellimonas sp. HMM57]|uniref:hypothetical protein n=1 Tax=unclassified Flagellimonas TaxID=2644544 RepID=UPI0013D04E5B|nr:MULTISPECIES: hypothetical protein [unclassified Flagellimonas]UII76528.1 hypothetical protein LV716_01695 [Flagellimonas sp. HMM57]